VEWRETGLSKRFREKITDDDVPKSLAKTTIRKVRHAMLRESHISPLTKLAQRIRRKEGLSTEVPHFDPMDGGVRGKVLFVLEAPGARAVSSGFISRNNPDETAKNMFNLLREAGFERNMTTLWNIVPWYIGSGTKIRAAQSQDIRRGMPYLLELIEMMTELQCIALIGQKAARAKSQLEEATGLPVIATYHPSPLFVNNRPENRRIILMSFKKIRTLIK